MTQVTWKMVARVLRWGAAVALVALMLIGWSVALSYKAENDTLTTAQARNRPVTDYNQAFFAHLDCIKQYEIRFFDDISDLLKNGRSSDPAVVARLNAATATDQTDLGLVFSRLCQPPTAPTFSPDGTLLSPPVVYPQVFPNPDTKR